MQKCAKKKKKKKKISSMNVNCFARKKKICSLSETVKILEKVHDEVSIFKRVLRIQ